MRKLTIITTILFAIISCSKDKHETVYEKFNGKWDIEQKFVDDVEVALNDCDSMYNRILIYDQNNSRWVFCKGSNAINHRIEFDVEPNGELKDMLLIPNGLQEDNKTFIAGKVANNVFEITYSNYNEPNIIDRKSVV